MKVKYAIAGLILITAVACNNEASVQDETDSAIHVADSNQSIYPENDDIMGKDTIPAPEQSNQPVLEKK